MDELDAARLGELGETLREAGRNGFFPFAQLVELDGGRGKIQADGGGIAGIGEEAGGMEEGFGRDAAAVEAGAAEGEAGIDEGDGQAEIGGEKRGGIAGGAGADDGEGGGCGHGRER